MKTKPITVVIADDHPRMRKGIRMLLERSGHIQVLGEAGNGREALALVLDVKPDILILDVEMPELNGIEVARRLRTYAPQTRFLALSAYDDPAYIQEMFANHAAAYLVKDEAPQRLVETIVQIAASEVTQPPARRSAAGAAPTETTLTPREVQYLRKLNEFASIEELAAELGRPLNEVQRALAALYSKLGVDSFEAARAFARSSGFNAKHSP